MDIISQSESLRRAVSTGFFSDQRRTNRWCAADALSWNVLARERSRSMSLDNVAKISTVGDAACATIPGVAARFFRVLARGRNSSALGDHFGD